MNDDRYFKLAKNVSELSDFKRYQLGCVCIYKNKVLSVGFNSNKTHPIQAKYNKERFTEDTPHKRHAEVHALSSLIDSDVDFSKIDIYVFRCFKNGQLAMARPCKSCMKLIQDLGIKRIHYTTENGYATEYIK